MFILRVAAPFNTFNGHKGKQKKIKQKRLGEEWREIGLTCRLQDRPSCMVRCDSLRNTASAATRKPSERDT
jgi:hypothetical protein